MDGNENTFEQELAKLKNWDHKYEKLYEPSVINSKANLLDKLDRYEMLEVRFKSLDFEAPRLFREQKRQLERKIYPNPIIRALFRMAKAIFKSSHLNDYDQEVRRNFKRSHDQIKAIGFPVNERQLERQIRQGNRDISIPVSYYVSENEKMEYELKLSRDIAGNYNLDKYQAKYQMTGPGGKVRSSEFIVGAGMDIKPRQAFNLLAGRSISVENGTGEKQWLQLDMNDKDATGNFRMKIFHKEYGFDLDEQLSKLALKNSMDYPARQMLLDALENGERVKVLDGKNKEITIEANPQKLVLDVYENGTLRNASLVAKPKDLFQETRQAEMKVVKPSKAKGIN